MKTPKQGSKPKKTPKQKQPPATAAPSAPCKLEVSYAVPESYFIPTADDGSNQESLVLMGVFDRSPLLDTEVQIFQKKEEKFVKAEGFTVVEGSVKVQQFDELHMRVLISNAAVPGPKFFTVKQYPRVGVGPGCIVELADVSFGLNSP